MIKAFFGALLLLFGGILWVTLPRALKNPCPVCQGRGVLEASTPIVVGKGKDWIQKKDLLCPFCSEGRISRYDLKLHQSQMLRWMVKEQKLAPDELVRRVKEGFGQKGLDELHQSNFFMESRAGK
jgi:hypothetical protein